MNKRVVSSTTRKWNMGGLQQVGVGVGNNQEMSAFYRDYFGFNVVMFDETGTADVMAPYMGNHSWDRHARLLINIHGGGGLEVWQYTNRTPLGMSEEIHLGHRGILSTHIRCKNLYDLREMFVKEGFETSVPCYTPDGLLRCFIRDKGYNWLCLEEHTQGWFIAPSLSSYTSISASHLRKYPHNNRYFSTRCGGVCGVTIGVKDMEKAIMFYSQVCGYDKVLYDITDCFNDFSVWMGQQKVRRVKLVTSQDNTGTFSHLLTNASIELIEAQEEQKEHIYHNRYWGDTGFIHLCFDVRGMDGLKVHCKELGHPFTIDTGEEFTMDTASGRFAYLEDPDGTLIEFVEVYRMPILAKLGISLSLKKRPLGKPLPKWLLSLLRFQQSRS